MKLYFKDSRYFAFEEDGSQDFLIKPEMVALTTNRPSQYHSPVIENGVHTGAWTEDAAQALADKRAAMVVSKAQAKIALKRAGLFGQINQMMKSLPDDDEVKIAWEDAQLFTRTSHTMLAVAAQFNLTDTQLDALFEDAMTVKI